MKPTHIPVLANEVLALLNARAGECYFDGTAGYGGHAREIMSKLGNGRVILSDRDVHATTVLESEFDGRPEVWHLDLVAAAKRLSEESIHPDLILLDLGVSSPQLDTPERGFSFKDQGPLDMRMDADASLSAADIVNTYSEQHLAGIIGQYGEEHRAKTVARAMIAARPLTTTTQLADVVRKVVPRAGGIDPATRTFQAIRMEVNQELQQLELALPLLTDALASGGRIAVISFHSLEDRIVKHWFDRESRDCVCPPGQPICTCNHSATLAKLTKRPILGTEDRNNPRARSAKLRAAAKLKQKPKEVHEGPN